MKIKRVEAARYFASQLEEIYQRKHDDTYVPE